MKATNKSTTGNVLSNIFLILSVLILIGVAVFVFTGSGNQFLFGYKPFIITTGSMETEYKTNCIVIVKQGPYDDIQIGDVVAFLPEQLGGSGAMHRVVEETANGFVTKGDNNEFPDDGYLTSENYIGRAVWHTNALAGYIDKLLEPNGVIKFFVIPLTGLLLLFVALKLILPRKVAAPITHPAASDESVGQETEAQDR